MKSIRIAVHYDDASIDPMHAFVCESPDVDRITILEGRPHDGMETVLCHVEGDAEAFEAAMAAEGDPMEYDITPDVDEGFFLYIRQSLGERDEDIIEALSRETVVVTSPIVFRPDRTMRMTLVGHAEELQAAIDGLPAGLTVEVLQVGNYSTAIGSGLTARQREALAVAWRLGFYEVPRDTGIEHVADELGCAVSTASDLIRRAGSRLVRTALDDPPR